MVSREARIGFVFGTLAAAVAACLWTSSKGTTEILESVRRTCNIVEKRAQSLDQLMGQITELASKSTSRLDAVLEVVEKNLVGSILELGGFVRSLRSKPGALS